MGLSAYRKTKQEVEQDDALKLAMLNMQKLKNPSNVTYGLAGVPRTFRNGMLVTDPSPIKRYNTQYKFVSNYDDDDDDEFCFL